MPRRPRPCGLQVLQLGFCTWHPRTVRAAPDSAPSFTIAFAIFDSNGIFSSRLRINHNHSMPPSPIIYDDSIRLRSNHLQSLHFELARAPDNPRTFLNALLVVQLDIRLFFFVVENNNNGIISILPWCANQRAGAIPPVTSRRSGDWGSIHTSIQAYIYIYNAIDGFIRPASPLLFLLTQFAVCIHKNAL